MPVRPTSGIEVVPLLTAFHVESPEIQGTAVALQFTGNAMQYLVVPHNIKSAPVWLGEQEVASSYIAQRPGAAG